MLADKEIIELINADPPLIRDFRSLAEQLQPAGFDVTVRKITAPRGEARLGGPHRSRVATESEILLEEGFYRLCPGYYIFYLNEYLSLPKDIAGIALARSTLMRCGGWLSSGLWDPGFRGRGRLGLSVANPAGLLVEADSPFAQISFFRLSGQSKGFQFNQYYAE
ncbi:hypothetical protein [Actinomadura sp. 21ATH]|uniref:dCTP deaminase domain-containing protein n=1 Tax=Actinomadura sp. 21ATH TaxID=1735444 RepID=UPI0035C04794